MITYVISYMLIEKKDNSVFRLGVASITNTFNEDEAVGMALKLMKENYPEYYIDNYIVTKISKEVVSKNSTAGCFE